MYITDDHIIFLLNTHEINRKNFTQIWSFDINKYLCMSEGSWDCLCALLFWETLPPFLNRSRNWRPRVVEILRESLSMTSPQWNGGYEVQQGGVREVADDLSVNMNLETARSLHICCETQAIYSVQAATRDSENDCSKTQVTILMQKSYLLYAIWPTTYSYTTLNSSLLW